MKIKDIDNTMYPSKIANHIVKEQNKEIEKLSKEVDMWNRKYNEQFDIITELEKWLKSEISYWGEDYETLMCSDRIIYLEETLNKLKELKEGE